MTGCEECPHSSEPVTRKGALQRKCQHPQAPTGFIDSKGRPRGPYCPLFLGAGLPVWCPMTPEEKADAGR